MPEIANTTRLLDQKFAEWVVQNFGTAHTDADRIALSRLAEAVSYAVHLKHSCLHLALIAKLQNPVLSRLLDGFDASTVKRVITAHVVPLVASHNGEYVWLHKYHAFEQSVVAQLRSKQKNNKLSIITGGPGTGKTWHAAQRINALSTHHPEKVIVLAAPTGKAANNMMLALAKANQSLVASNLQAKTLHSLLGIGRSSPLPHYGVNNTLRGDVFIVDEASMIDLPMMQRLLTALPPQAELILLGDKDQLSSVEAGSVLNEICNDSHFKPCITVLDKSYRYEAVPEIGVLAEALNSGTVPDLAHNTTVMAHVLSSDNVWEPGWLATAVDWFTTLQRDAASAEHKDILQRQAQFQILCALREGPQGVQGINSMLEKALHKTPGSWYAGKPVMITRTDHERKLYNGDVGMVLPMPDGTLSACFLTGGEVKSISSAQMPSYDTCYAITIHKAQGSEYERVVIVLPADVKAAQQNSVLTRELVYTAVTRAKQKIDVWSGQGVLQVAAAKTTQRMSGLVCVFNNG